MTPIITLDIPMMLAGAMLLLSLIMVSRMRLASLVSTFRYQSALLSLYAVVLALGHDELSLLIAALVIALVKVVLIPAVILRYARKSDASERLDSYLRPTMSTAVGLGAILLAFAAANATFAADAGTVIVACVFSLILTGLILLITRKDMFGQGVGFLVMENGIYAFGLALTGGMPLFVELAVLLDLLALAILMIALFRVAQKVHASVSTDYLTRLID